MSGINSFILIIIYGALILLSFLLIINPLKVNKKANLWFGVFLFLWSTFWLEEIFILTSFNPLNNIPLIPLRFFQFLTPLVFYFSIEYYSNPDFKFKKKELIYTILPFTFLIGLIFQNYNKHNTLIPSLLSILIIIQALYFTIYSYIKIQHHKKSIRLFSSNTNEVDLKWIEYIIIAIFLLSIFIGIYNLAFNGEYLNVMANIVSILIIFFVASNTLKQKEIFLLNEKERNLIIKTEQQPTPKKRKIISDENLVLTKSKLIDVMENKKPYLDTELTLVSLAKLIKITPHQLSYVINVGFNENFFWFVNRYRVQRVKELLLNKDYNHISILGIAYESGFNSKTSFNTTFKKISAQTPSEFKKSSSSL
ncbi:helix-turn-helix domain-containing protein [Tenacibaculum ovolyticum]|mgnify:CR=1 FL=1|uniref:helix-turn-helix domain-containing protein n=1 Tax=Tenacibaculum ovolyticum TaxID=104270 RepID=UPI00040044F5|nr:helix-turn-helix domain-containing protein [Tenacibaculum ovolyticum]